MRKELFSVVIILGILGCCNGVPVPETQRHVKFTISYTWDGKPLPQEKVVNISLQSIPDSKDVRLLTSSRFYDDPPPNGEPGKPFLGLWDYEVVEAFFLNDNDQYLEVEIGPHGQHIVLLLNGQRNTIRHSLPLNVTTTIDGSYWLGNATIPGDYFPPQVTKMNAYAIHGVGKDRQYLAMHPASGTQQPDFHNLAFFGPVNMEEINPLHKKTDGSLSPLWRDALQGKSLFAKSILRYKISQQWNGLDIDMPASRATLQGFEGGVEINYTMPKNDDLQPAESFVVMFENAEKESFRLQLFADGNHATDFFLNRTDKINRGSLPVDYRIDTRYPDHVKGSALVPPSYFPPNVRLMNIYASFGIEKMLIMSLSPVTEPTDSKPDMENINHFVPVDFDLLVESNTKYSDIWRRFLKLPLTQTKSDEVLSSKVESENTSPASTNGDEGKKVQDVEAHTSELVSEKTLPKQEVIKKKETKETKNNAETDQNGKAENEGVKKDYKPEEAEQVKNTQSRKRKRPRVPTRSRKAEKVTTLATELVTEAEPKSKIGNDESDQDSMTTPSDLSERENTTQQQNTDSPQSKGSSSSDSDIPTEEATEDAGLVTESTDPSLGDEVSTTSQPENSISSNVDHKIKEEGADVDDEATKEQRTDPSSFNHPLESLLEGKSSVADERMVVESITEVEETASTPAPEEDQIVPEVEDTFTITERDEDALATEDTTNLDLITENENLSTVSPDIERENLLDLDMEESEFSTTATQEITPTEEGDKGKDIADGETEDTIQKSSVREEYQRRYEDSENKENELPITFKITFKSSTPKEEPRLTQEEEEKLEQDIAEFLSPSDELLPLDVEDTDYIPSLLDLLPPPHPICFTEGLVPDFYRCQVFYECVLADGQWEMYSWRCKRGYYYDAEKVACIKGYC